MNIILVILLIISISITASLYNNSIQSVFSEHGISWDNVILSRVIDERQVYMFKKDVEGEDFLGLLSLEKTRLGFREDSFELTDRYSDITLIHLFNMDNGKSSVYAAGEIISDEITALDIELESGRIVTLDIIEKAGGRYFIAEVEEGRMSFIRHE